jgi:hypothetical protein
MRTTDADALVVRLSDFLARNYEPLYDLDDISELKWPIEHEQQKAAWMKVLRRVMDAEPTVGDWISVNEQRPKSGKHVLLCCEIRGLYRYKSRYHCIGFYAAKHSIPEGKYPVDAEFYDYDEEEDEYYLQEGWYEVIHNWGEYSSVVIDDFVTHWKPLDELPKEE